MCFLDATPFEQSPLSNTSGMYSVGESSDVRVSRTNSASPFRGPAVAAPKSVPAVTTMSPSVAMIPSPGFTTPKRALYNAPTEYEVISPPSRFHEVESDTKNVHPPGGMSNADLPGGVDTPQHPGGMATSELPGGRAPPDLPSGMAIAELPHGRAPSKLPGGVATPELPVGMAAPDLHSGMATAKLSGGRAPSELLGGMGTSDLPGGIATPELPGGMATPVLPSHTVGPTPTEVLVRPLPSPASVSAEATKKAVRHQRPGKSRIMKKTAATTTSVRPCVEEDIQSPCMRLRPPFNFFTIDSSLRWDRSPTNDCSPSTVIPY